MICHKSRTRLRLHKFSWQVNSPVSSILLLDFMSALLLDALKREFTLPTDSALARHLGEARQVISTIRLGGKVQPALIIKIHKQTQWPISAIETLIDAKAPA